MYTPYYNYQTYIYQTVDDRVECKQTTCIRRCGVFAVNRHYACRQICLVGLVDAAGHAGILEGVNQAGVGLQKRVDGRVVVAVVVVGLDLEEGRLTEHDSVGQRPTRHLRRGAAGAVEGGRGCGDLIGVGAVEDEGVLFLARSTGADLDLTMAVVVI